MALSSDQIQDIVNEEVRKRQSILEAMHRKIYKRVVELQLQPGEIVGKIQRVDGVLVEFEKR